jgi:porphobilinogen synthase
MLIRPRRLRGTPALRSLVRETRLSSEALIQPLFIQEGHNIKNPITSLDGQFHYSPDRVAEAIESGLAAGVSKFLLFGIPSEKDGAGSQAYADEGVVQQGLRAIRQRYGREVCLITDVCLCEYTDHGHCGLLKGDTVDNDPTLALLARTAVSHAAAGADVIAPSDMMDGRVRAIREALDASRFESMPILSYAVKYASSYYGPFREAAGSAPSFGDRKSYQMDFHNSREALREVRLDEAEGADAVIVKPALAYLDIIKAVASETDLPVAAYNVSGEYAMVKAAGKLGLINEYAVMCETAVAAFRAGASIYISYFAPELAAAIRKGDIG